MIWDQLDPLTPFDSSGDWLETSYMEVTVFKPEYSLPVGSNPSV